MSSLCDLVEACSDNCIVDEKWVFSNYTERYYNGGVANIPKIIGTTAREAAPLVTYPIHNVSAGPWEEAVVSSTVNTVCLAYNTSVIREKVGLAPMWRYEWAGNFSNISPLWWLGAYHYSDLYMFFGSYPIAPGPIPQFEVETANTMQDYLYDFIADPYKGLTKHGYPQYLPLEGKGGKLAQFGADGKTAQIVDGDSVEGVCHIPGASYDTSP